MADTESLGAGRRAMARSARRGAHGGQRARAHPDHHRPARHRLLEGRHARQTDWMVDLERRAIDAFVKLGVSMTDTCINYQTIQAPTRGEHVAFGDTGVVIYSNSVCGARSNFEGGPSALSAGLTGRTPRYGFHLDAQRRATLRIRVDWTPTTLNDWGALGGVVGRLAGNYWSVPVVEGLEGAPGSDAAEALRRGDGELRLDRAVPPRRHHARGACGSTTSAATGCPSRTASARPRSKALQQALRRRRRDRRGRVLRAAAEPVRTARPGRAVRRTPLRQAAARRHQPAGQARLRPHGLSPQRIEDAGGTVLSGMCFYQSYAREIAEANGWKRLATNSAKLVNILGGYGYVPMLASMEALRRRGGHGRARMSDAVNVHQARARDRRAGARHRAGRQ